MSIKKRANRRIFWAKGRSNRSDGWHFTYLSLVATQRTHTKCSFKRFAAGFFLSVWFALGLGDFERTCLWILYVKGSPCLSFRFGIRMNGFLLLRCIHIGDKSFQLLFEWFQRPSKCLAINSQATWATRCMYMCNNLARIPFAAFCFASIQFRLVWFGLYIANENVYIKYKYTPTMTLPNSDENDTNAKHMLLINATFCLWFRQCFFNFSIDSNGLWFGYRWTHTKSCWCKMYAKMHDYGIKCKTTHSLDTRAGGA